MNRFFLLIMMNVFAISIMNAQTCDPDLTLPDSVVISPLPYTDAFPEDGIRDTACVNGYYETVLTFNIPGTYDFNGSPVPLGYVAIAGENGINNLPESMSYSCNPPDCLFRGDSIGCILIYGTAVVGDIGQHDLTMDATFNVGGFNISQTLPGAIIAGNYYLNIQPEGSPNCTIIDAIKSPEEIDFSIRSNPNPTDAYTEFVIEAENSGDYYLSVHDFLGRELYTKKINIFAGKNTIPFDAGSLASGIYIYTLQKDNQKISGKLLVARQ